MDGDGNRYDEAELFAVIEGSTYADTLGEGVHGHQADQEEGGGGADNPQ